MMNRAHTEVAEKALEKKQQQNDFELRNVKTIPVKNHIDTLEKFCHSYSGSRCY